MTTAPAGLRPTRAPTRVAELLLPTVLSLLARANPMPRPPAASHQSTDRPKLPAEQVNA